uniref:Uncharacterized protein n=1 Tax=Arundo donax TaxID=35708 RepID=A0A0A8YPH0_ARUDO
MAAASPTSPRPECRPPPQCGRRWHRGLRPSPPRD